MNRNTFYPVAGVLVLAVSPLLAQQGDAPAPPQPEAPQVEEEAAEAYLESLDDEARAAILEFAEAIMDAQGADDGVDEESEDLAVDAPDDEPANEAEAEAQAEALVEREAVPLRRAQQGVVVERAVVVRGNNGRVVVGGRGGPNARVFDEAIAGLPELPLGAVTDAVTSENEPSSYRFDALGPGLLTVAVRAQDGDDLTIEVYGPGGELVAECDNDMGEDGRSEYMALPIPEAGSYRVIVPPYSSSNGGAFWMGASWLDFQELEAVVPTGPGEAVDLTPGQPQDAALENNETWFTYTAPANGLLMFSTTADEGDLVLEAYYEGSFDQQVQSSDQDRNGNGANERILMDLTEGQTVYLKARSFGGGEDFAFNVRSRFIEDDE